MADIPNDKGSPAIPPKLDLRKSGVVPGEAPLSQAGEKQPLFTLKSAAEPALGTAAKRETSRIPLDAAKPAAGDGPSTIRIKPAAAPATIRVGGADAVEAGAAKRTTSRISLESVLGAEGAKPGAEGGPRTIRLKRPGTPASAGEGAEMGGTPTIKRTVRVKRAVETEKPTVARTAPEDMALELAGAEDVVNPTFPIMGIVAVLVVGVLIYVLMAQVFGPDSSMTQLSYGWRDADMSWPGKIPTPGR